MKTLRTLRALFTASLSASVLLAAPAVFACGGPFGPGVEVDPAQTIIVSHLAGVERYEFNPTFCGKGAEFGLILPVPSPLEGQPALGQASLRDELEDLSKPVVVKSEERFCPSRGPGFGAGGPEDGAGGISKGVDVVDAGTVGFLDFTVLKADSESSLTDFLDSNGYPYNDAAKASFTHYVTKGWYFVAFKVAAGDAPPEGKRLCGDLGPVVLSFKTEVAVVPTRILSDARSYKWRLYTLSEQNRGPVGANEFNFGNQLQFSGAITADDLAKRPALAAIAAPGQRLTRHDIGFMGNETVNDLLLPVSEAPEADFRATDYQTTYIPDQSLCGGSGGASAGGAAGGQPSPSGGSGGTSSYGVGAAGASAPAPAAAPTSDDGCATSPSGPQSFLAGLGVMLAGLLARRRKP